MEVTIALVSVVVILAIAFTVVLRRQPITNTQLPPALPTLTAAEIPRDSLRDSPRSGWPSQRRP
jgi:hypothetical protein